MLILTVQHEQLRESALHSELEAMDEVLHRQYEQYKRSKEGIRLINSRYHELKIQIADIRAERDRLAPQLAACPAIERVYPSDANFILVRTPDPDRMYDALISAGAIVRNRSRIPGCEGCLRITVGTPAENARMIETVKNFRL